MASEIQLTGTLSLKKGVVQDSRALNWRGDWTALGARTAPSGTVTASPAVADSGYTSFSPWSSGTAWATWGANNYRALCAVVQNLSTNDGKTEFGGLSTVTPLGQCPFIVLATADATTVPTNREEVGQYEFAAIPPGASFLIPLAIYNTNLKARAFRYNGSVWVACAAKLRIYAAEL